MRYRIFAYLAFMCILNASSIDANSQCVMDGQLHGFGSPCWACGAWHDKPVVKGKNLPDSINRKQPIQNSQLNRNKYLKGDGSKPYSNKTTCSNRSHYTGVDYLDYLDGDEKVKEKEGADVLRGRVNNVVYTKKDTSLPRPGVLDGIYVKDHVPTKKAIHYKPTCQYELKDTLMWEKRVWRKIEEGATLNEVFFANRYSNKQLWQVIVDALKKSPDSLQAYSYTEITGNIFTNPTSNSFAYGALERRIPNAWILVEDWYFDKVRSVMDVKIIGICPVVPDIEPGEGLKLFLIYFPQLAPILKHAKLNMPGNSIENYYDLFWKRMFKSTIIKESNVIDSTWNPEKDVPASFKK
ncbi:MAG TPA: hypothetical protein VK177_05025 [Flavobacteriales bacterium]|nr:hypothetical protein [Flavobacteriales bacterium]